MKESQKRILIADESQHIRDILKTHFEARGYETITCDDGEDALHLIHEKHPDLIILDIAIPRKNGYQICRQIKSEKAYGDVFVILLSSKEQKEEEFWAKDCGANEFLIKPFIASELEKIVEEHFEEEQEHKLKDKITIDDEIASKKRKKKSYAICSFELHQKSSTLFEQKYGEIRYSEMLDNVIETIEEYGKKFDKNMIFEMEEENEFRLLLEGKRKDIQTEVDKLTERINDLLKDLHDEEDYKKGFIRRNILTDQVEKAPPLSIKITLSFSKSKKS